MNRRTFGKLFLVCALLILHTNVWFLPQRSREVDGIVLLRDAAFRYFPHSVILRLRSDEGLFAVAGDRKVRIQEIHISSGNPVPWRADWQLFVEDKLGNDRFVTGGSTTGDFGPPAAFNAMTGAQMRTAVKNAVLADINVPANDSVN